MIKSKRCAGHVATMEETRGAFKILIDKSIGKKPLGRSSYKWKGNIAS